MANARDVYNVDANKAGLADPQNKQFDLSFPYLSQSHVSVTVNGTATTAFTYATSTRIQLNTGPTAGDVVVIKRATSPNTRLVDYQTGSVLSDEILDRDSLQAFYLAQEANDVADIVLSKNASDLFDAGNERITNVANPTGAQDVATKNYLESTWLSASDKTQLNALNTTNLNTVAGSVSNVNTVAGAITNVNTVAGKTTEITALGTSANVSNMGTLAASGVVGNIASVAGISSDVTTVAGKASLITSDFVSDLNTVAVTDVINDINTLATSDIVSDLNTLATSDIVSDLNTLATSDIVSDVNLLATSDIVSDLNQLATSDFVSDLNQLATTTNVNNLGTVAGAIGNVNSVGSSIGNVNTVAGISSAVSTVAADATDIGNVSGSIANVNTVATNISGVNSFAAQYRIGSSDPTGSLDEGDLFYNTTANQLKIYNGTQWENAAPAGSGFLATSGGTMTGNLALGDNVKATFGAGDLEIYSDGNNAVINEVSGTGSLLLQGQHVRIKTPNGAETMAEFLNDGAVKLYHNNVAKISTSAIGIDVNGTVQADQFNNDEALPDVRPSLLLDFANSKTLDPRITFTRGSTATFYDGKTTAKAEENLLKYSQDVSNAAWAKNGVTIAADNTAAPDGTNTADKITITTEGTFRGISQVFSVGVGVTLAVSFYVKKSTHDYTYIGFNSYNGNSYLATNALKRLNLSNGASIGTDIGTCTITDVGSGWFRVTAVGTTSANTTKVIVVVDFMDSNALANPSTNIAAGSAIFAWGLQLEKRSAPTAYTPTTTAPIVKYQPVLQTAASGEARFDHDPLTGESKGLLIEEARTNLVKYSGDLNAATANTGHGWIFGSTLSSFFSYIPAQKIAPDGTQTGVEFISTANTSQGLFLRTNGLTFAAATYTASMWVYVPTQTGVNNWGMQVDFGDAESTLVNNVTSFDQWHRISVTVTTSATRNFVDFSILYNNTVPDNDDFFKFYVWGAQVEAGSFPTSYIPTTGAAATRAAEYASITGTNFSEFFSNQVGTLYAQFGVVDAGHAEIGERLVTVYPSDSTEVKYNLEGYRAEIRSQGTWNGINFPNESRNGGRVALGFDFTGFSAASNGADAASITAQPTHKQAGRMFIGSAQQYGHCNCCLPKISYYSKRLSTATLKAMTTE